MGLLGKVFESISGALDVYENTRKDNKENKSSKRDYSANNDYKFSGNKKDDFYKIDPKTITPIEESKKAKKTKDNLREEEK